MTDEIKLKLEPNTEFEKILKILADTPPISNKEITNRSKKNKKK